MKKLYAFFVFAFFHLLNLQGHIIEDIRSMKGESGNLNDYTLCDKFKGIYSINTIKITGSPFLFYPTDVLESKDIKQKDFISEKIKKEKIEIKNSYFPCAFKSQSKKNDINTFSITSTPKLINSTSTIIKYEKLRNGSTSNRLTVNFAAITDSIYGIDVSPGSKPRLYFKLSSNANAFKGNTSADNGWKWVETTGVNSPFDFKIDYSILFGGQAPLKSIIQYFVVAQNLSASSNVTFNPSSGAVGNNVSPEGMTAPTTPNSFTIVQLMPGSINVGTRQSYATLTASNGLFAAINNGCINTNTVVNIVSDITEPGEVSLNEICEEGANAGNLTLTIQSDGSPHILSNTPLVTLNPLISITGAKRLTIDGGISKCLTFRNTYPNPMNTGSVIQFNNSSQNDTLTNCYLESNSSYNGQGVIKIGAIGENYVSIIQNDIRDARDGNKGNPVIGIYSVSDKNKLNIIDNNIYNLKNYDSYGINLNAVADGCIITGNSIYMENGITAVCPFTGIMYYASNNHLIKGNFIGGSAPKCGGNNPFSISGSGIFTGIYSKNPGFPVATIQDNTIQNIKMNDNSAPVFYGINNYDGPITITGNTIGNTTVSNSIQIGGTGKSAGIIQSHLGAANSSIIEKNTIANISLTNETGTPTFSALKTAGGIVRMNKIFNLGSISNTLTPVIYGINNLYGCSVNEYSNNVISLNGGAATAALIYGFYENSESVTTGFYFNSINLYGTSSGTSTSYAFYRNFQCDYVSNNNILVNTRIGGSGNHYAIYTNVTSGLISNFNDFFVTGKTLGHWGKNDKSDLNAWMMASNQDANSICKDPLFTSSLTLLPLDSSYVNGAGKSVTGLTTDINETIRNLTTPTVGAYELMCYAPLDGGSIAGDQTISNAIPALIINSTSPVGYSGRLEYKWQNATMPFTAWEDIPSSNTSTYQPGVIVKTTRFKRLARTSCMSDWTGAIGSNEVTITLAVNKWKGGSSNEWNKPENWTLNKIPDLNENILFDDVPLNDCYLDQNRIVNDVTINQNNRLLNINGNALTIRGNLNFSNGAQIDASFPNSSLVFSGNTFQTIPSNAFKNNKVYSMTIDNSAGVSPGSDITIDSLLIINSGKQFVIPTEKLINVKGIINNYAGASGLIIKASSTGEDPNGSIIFHNDASKGSYVPATVEMYSKASNINGDFKWQFFGIPVRSVIANPTLSGSYIREMLENVTGTTNHWIQFDNESVLTSFTGYEITQDKCKVINFEGDLENEDYNSHQLSFTPEATFKGQHLIGNPYVAAINIKNTKTPSNALVFGDGMDKTVYLYNTGSKDDWYQNGLNGRSSRNTAGQYISIPQENAGIDSLPSSIPSMQAFLVMVKTPGETATISIPYSSTETMVKNSTLQRITSPGKICTRIDVSGSNFNDRMWIFTDSNCKRGFDNGWDGYKIMGSVLAPQIYAMEEDGNFQVNSVDDINNTNLGFRAGCDSMYTMTFTHTNKDQRYKKIFLMDISNNKTVDITTTRSHYIFNSNPGVQIEKRFKIIALSDSIDISTEGKTNNKDRNQLIVFSSKNTVFVNNQTNSKGNLYLYDMSGRLYLQLTFKANEITTFPIILAKGSYLSKAITQTEEFTAKLILGE